MNPGSFNSTTVSMLPAMDLLGSSLSVSIFMKTREQWVEIYFEGTNIFFLHLNQVFALNGFY